MRSLILIASCAWLTSCASSSYDVQGIIDSADKSVAMPAGGGPITSAVKKGLRHQGWKIVVLDNVTTTQQVGHQLVTGKASNARYTLFLDGNRWDTCITGEGSYHVQASLIDNRTSEEVFNYEASACENDISDNVLSLMAGKQPAKPKFSGN